MMMHKIIVGVIAGAMLCGMNYAYGFNAKASEFDTPINWHIREAGNRSDTSDPLDIDFPDMFDGMDRPVSIDFFSDSRSGDDRSFLDDGLKIALGKDNELAFLDKFSDWKGNEALPAVAWDAAAWIDSVLDAGLTNSDTAVPLFLGTWSDSGFNNVYSDNVVAIPEPATYGLITIFGGGLLLFRRRSKR
jgi:hypothetical protein